jgi:hypothetical protein
LALDSLETPDPGNAYLVGTASLANSRDEKKDDKKVDTSGKSPA